MRGGTAHCTVIIGDEPIGSPLVSNPQCVIALSLPSADKYEPLVQTGGMLIADGTVMRRAFQREDILTLAVPAHSIAIQLGDERLVNVTMLGALLQTCNVVSLAAVEGALRKQLPVRHRHLLPANISALHAGAEWATEHTALRVVER